MNYRSPLGRFVSPLSTRLPRFDYDLLIEFETSVSDYYYYSKLNLELGFRIFWSLAFKIWHFKWNSQSSFQISYSNSSSKLHFRLTIWTRGPGFVSGFLFDWEVRKDDRDSTKNSEIKFQIWIRRRIQKRIFETKVSILEKKDYV